MIHTDDSMRFFFSPTLLCLSITVSSEQSNLVFFIIFVRFRNTEKFFGFQSKVFFLERRWKIGHHQSDSRSCNIIPAENSGPGVFYRLCFICKKAHQRCQFSPWRSFREAQTTQTDFTDYDIISAENSDRGVSYRLCPISIKNGERPFSNLGYEGELEKHILLTTDSICNLASTVKSQTTKLVHPRLKKRRKRRIQLFIIQTFGRQRLLSQPRFQKMLQDGFFNKRSTKEWVYFKELSPMGPKGCWSKRALRESTLYWSGYCLRQILFRIAFGESPTTDFSRIELDKSLVKSIPHQPLAKDIRELRTNLFANQRKVSNRLIHEECSEKTGITDICHISFSQIQLGKKPWSNQIWSNTCNLDEIE